MLNKSNDEYIKIWDLNLTTRVNKDKYLHIIDLEYQEKIENNIHGRFSFILIEEKF
ncbi:hypothetical protein KPL33_13130 [Clostridium algidicarnis]|uniref:hypothetical protein n=1 Tax=Clostridium algidicarnis TaxID=37659 RepID=UPI001C0B0F8F|nr:hypothetical protein [Clostridium algidicarnis]MBU3207905.1 hypothetical protein [Clostridium algidicarnis]